MGFEIEVEGRLDGGPVADRIDLRAGARATRRNRFRFATPWRLAAYAVLLVAGCTDDAPTAPVEPPLATGLWVFHIAGGRFDTHIQLWNILELGDRAAPLRLDALPARWWNGTRDQQVNPRASAGSRVYGEYRWRLNVGAGDTVFLRYRVWGDTAIGTLVENDSGTVVGPLSAVGVRIPHLILTSAPAGVQLSQTDPTPIVLLRVDDDQPTDRDFLQRLKQRDLVAELAVPTQLVGRNGNPTWEEIRGWVQEGFSAAAHSRNHTAATTTTDQSFMGEVLGSMADLAQQGLPTTVFVQPGSWTDSVNFQTSGLLRGWRGSLFRTFTRDLEGYVYYVPQVMPLADSVRLGIAHVTFSDGQSDAYILNQWRAAQGSRRFSVFLVHTIRLPSPGALDWILDSLAAAKQAGRIRLARSTAEVFTPDPE